MMMYADTICYISALSHACMGYHGYCIDGLDIVQLYCWQESCNDVCLYKAHIRSSMQADLHHHCFCNHNCYYNFLDEIFG